MSVEDTLTRRQVFIQRFAGGQAKEAARILERVYKRAIAKIAENPDSLRGMRLQRLTADIRRLLDDQFDMLNDSIASGVLDFADNEAEFTARALGSESSVLLNTANLEAVRQAVTSSGMDTPIGTGKLTLNQALDQFAKNKKKEILTAINDGVLMGETTPEITKRVQALASKRPKRQVDALVRTAINHAGAMAKKATIQENNALFESEEWVATLDSRTTLICAGRDGNIYPVGEGPQPPAHWNCRSLRVPVLKPEFTSGSQSVKRKTETKTVTGATKFDGWLRRQDASFQDEYFSQFANGKEKAALFRRGGLEIQQFRSEDGANYTLDDLRRLEPLAFSKANIT